MINLTVDGGYIFNMHVHKLNLNAHNVLKASNWPMDDGISPSKPLDDKFLHNRI